MHHWLTSPKVWVLGPLTLLLVVIVACGSSATSTPAGPGPTTAPTATPVPTSQAGPTDAPAMSAPAGTLNVGIKELGPFAGHGTLAGNPAIGINSGNSLTESLGIFSTDSNKIVGSLAESWDISPDGQVWTFNLRKGVQFHKGFGEMTVEDVIWSFENVANSEKHPRAANVGKFFFAENGSREAPDDYTWVVDLGAPVSDVSILESLGSPKSVQVWITSKKQFDQDGEEEANTNTAATGSWEITEWRTGEFWRMSAVEDHWRQTPYFAEMIQWEIPEESARVAGFQTGNLDTFQMALDSLNEVEQVVGAQLMQVPNAGQAGLNFYGQSMVPNPETGQPYDNYSPELPWVSADTDTNSAEWEAARKVRLAMSIAIDRQLLVDTLLQGFGRPLALRDWAGPDEARLPADMVWEFNPERAKELLAEAGYADGFSVTLTPAIRGAPSEVETCEAIAEMWEDIGLDVNFQRIPYGTLRPQLVGRTYEGVTCHSVQIRGAPVEGFSNYLNDTVFSYGTHHPYLEEKLPIITGTVSTAAREALELEIADWMFDNVFGETGLYVVDNVWPVGPNINPWDEFIKQGDLRLFNGFEHISPR